MRWVINYSGLAGGFLTGKHRRDALQPESARARRVQDRCYTDCDFHLLDKMAEIGQHCGRGVIEVALA